MPAWLSATAQDAVPLFKAKCAICHRDLGQGKSPIAPKIAGLAKLQAALPTGEELKAPHIKPMSTLTTAQVTSIAAIMKTLK